MVDSEGGEGGSRRRGGPAGGLDKERMWLTNSQPSVASVDEVKTVLQTSATRSGGAAEVQDFQTQ